MGGGLLIFSIKCASNCNSGTYLMVDLQVTCIKRLMVHVQNGHAGITHLGGENWLLTRGKVNKAINAGTDTFYTFVDGKRAEVRVRSGFLNYHPGMSHSLP